MIMTTVLCCMDLDLNHANAKRSRECQKVMRMPKGHVNAKKSRECQKVNGPQQNVSCTTVFECFACYLM